MHYAHVRVLPERGGDGEVHRKGELDAYIKLSYSMLKYTIIPYN